MAMDTSYSAKSSSTEELRLKNYKSQVEARHEIDMRELEQKNAEDVQRLQENYVQQEAQLRNAYEVQISTEAEALDEKLQQTRFGNEERVGAEKNECTGTRGRSHRKCRQPRRRGAVRRALRHWLIHPVIHVHVHSREFVNFDLVRIYATKIASSNVSPARRRCFATYPPACARLYPEPQIVQTAARRTEKRMWASSSVSALTECT